MILKALADYYDRLAEDPQSGVAPMGFSTEKISFCLVIDDKGNLQHVSDLRSGDEGKPRAIPMIVPDRGGRSGKLLKPYFLWDNTGYVLGADSKGKADRSREAFEAFTEFHQKMAELIDDDGLHAVCKFLSKWKPADAASVIGKFAEWEDVQDTNVIFQLKNARQYVHQSAAVKKGWLKFIGSDTDIVRGLCLVSGQDAPLARLHPAIQGVAGAQSVGAAIVSFNLDAFTSYGKEQSFNAPVSSDIAFKYTTALNHLLSGRSRRVQLADATVIWWADKATEFEDAFGNVLSGVPDAEDTATNDRVKEFLTRLKSGISAKEIKNADVPFYVLGLSPNAARISIRLWLQSTVGELYRQLKRHLDDLEIVPGRFDDPFPPSLRDILRETARDADGIPAPLSAGLTRAAITGGMYPDALFTSVLRRIRTDRTLRYRRAAILKACLLRRWRVLNIDKEIPVALDEQRKDAPYVLGRLFAELEKIQEDASGGSLNRSMKDSYFGSAAATPAAIFPRLIALSGHHQRKLEGGIAVNHQKRLAAIMAQIQEFPQRLSNEEQGLFYIGYYHQREAFFVSNKEKDITPSTKEKE